MLYLGCVRSAGSCRQSASTLSVRCKGRETSNDDAREFLAVRRASQMPRPDSSVVERGPEKAGVGGSIPSLATTLEPIRYEHVWRFASVVQAARLLCSVMLDRANLRPSTQSISVYTRHKADCKGHAGQPHSRKCDCNNYIYLLRDGKRQTISAKTRSWSVARAEGSGDPRQLGSGQAEAQGIGGSQRHSGSGSHNDRSGSRALDGKDPQCTDERQHDLQVCDCSEADPVLEPPQEPRQHDASYTGSSR